MLKVLVKNSGNYPISASKIKKHLSNFLKQEGIVSNSEVSVALVGEKKMIDIAKTFLKEQNGKTHNVLSFTEAEVEKHFIMPPDDVMRIGEIIVCYPKAVEEAKNENLLVDDKVIALIEHGTQHLLGRHHD